LEKVLNSGLKTNGYNNYLLVLEHERLVRQVKGMEPKALPVTTATAKMKTQYETLIAANPPVFKAAKSVMQFAALFRAIKAVNATSWQSFMAKISQILIYPEVETPTLWMKE
jgi:hypothetical protein